MEEKNFPNWDEMSKEEKMVAIEQVLDEDVRPYVSRDGGGVDVVELQGEHTLIIAYKGACAHCFAATGATLSYIQQVMRSKINDAIEVVPKF